MNETERMRTLRECAQLVAKSREVSCSSVYAVSREIWSLWWKDSTMVSLTKSEIKSLIEQSKKILEMSDDEVLSILRMAKIKEEALEERLVEFRKTIQKELLKLQKYDRG